MFLSHWNFPEYHRLWSYTEVSVKECFCCLPHFGCSKSFAHEVGCSLGTCNTFESQLIDSSNFPRSLVTKKKLEPFYKIRICRMVNKLWQSLTNALRIEELVALIREITQKNEEIGVSSFFPCTCREYSTAVAGFVVGFWKVPVVSLLFLLL